MNRKDNYHPQKFYYFIIFFSILIFTGFHCSSGGMNENRYGIKKIVLADTRAHIQPEFNKMGTEYLIAPVAPGADELIISSVSLYGKGIVTVDGREMAGDSPVVLDNLTYGINTRKLYVVYPGEKSREYTLDIYRALPINKPAKDTDGKVRFKNNNDGTITDTETSLIWMQDPSQIEMMSWYEAFEYIEKMNSDAQYGHTDWRLPSIKEYRTLLNHNVVPESEWLNKAGFIDIQGMYWSSTTYAVESDEAWNAWFAHSHAPNCSGKNKNIYIWPVCSQGIVPETGAHLLEEYTFHPMEDGKMTPGIEWPGPRFCDNGDGTMTDNMTGLMWLKNAGISGLKNYDDTVAFIISLNTPGNNDNCGYNDWRIPDLTEMETLINFGTNNIAVWLENCDPGFENVRNFYWTSTPFYTDSSRASVWFISLQAGITAEFGLDTPVSVWPVR
jgi:hypothetical protein